MRVLVSVALGGLAMALGACADDEQEIVKPSVPELTTEQLAQRAKFGVAFIKAVDYADKKKAGSGVVVYADKEKTQIITAQHVVGEGMRVSLGGQPPQSARILGRAGCKADLALVETDTPPRVTVIPMRNDPVRIGERVVAMGYSSVQAHDNSPEEAAVKEGQISRADVRNLSMGRDVVRTPSAIQTDAAINPADSGGYLGDRFGRLVGINVFKEASTEVDNVGYALPVPAIRPLMGQMRSGKTGDAGWELWAVDRSFPVLAMVSTVYSDLSPGLASAVAGVVRSFKPRGMMVVDRQPGRPAGRLPVGVLIQKVNGATARSMTQICDVWDSQAPGSTVAVSGIWFFGADSPLNMFKPFERRIRVPR